MNQYFDWPAKSAAARFVRFATVRADDVNQAFDEVAAGFDKIPAPAALWAGVFNFGEATGDADAWAVSIAPASLLAYSDGMSIRVRFPSANTATSPTINLNGLGAKPICRDSGANLIAGDIGAGMVVLLTYNSGYGKFQATQVASSIDGMVQVATEKAAVSVAQATIATTKASEAATSATEAETERVLAQTAAVEAQTAIPPVQVADYAALRAYAGTATKLEVTGYLPSAPPSGTAALFIRDDSDSTSSDDNDTVLVASNGVRWRRHVLTKPTWPYTSSPVRFYGDSQTVGVGASTPALSYAQVLARKMGWTRANRAISGGSIMDWIVNAYSDNPEDDAISVVLPGFNDARYVGTNASQQSAYRLALYAAVAHLAIPNSKKLKATAAGITFAGTWATNPTRSYGKYTSTLNDTATFSRSGDTVYISTVQQLGNGGLLNVTVDGVDKGTYSLMQAVANGGAVSTMNYMPMLIRITGLGDGVHTVVCKNVGKDASSGNANTYIDWVAGSSSRAKTNAKVYVGNTLRMDSTGYASDSPNYNKASDAVMAAFSRIAEQVCADLAADGLDVCYVDASGAYDPLIEASADHVHANDTGHASIASAFAAAADTRQRPGMVGVLSQVRKNRKDIAAIAVTYVAPVAGTWTPELRGITTAGSNTYSAQAGSYVTSGGVCHASFELGITSLDVAMVGALIVTLPVAAAGTDVGSVGQRTGISMSADCTGLYLETIAGSARAVLRQASSTTLKELPPANISGGAILRASIGYRV